MDADCVVIGAGVVGLACARELAARGREVVLIKRHERFGVETSSRNSEVVHAGLYYPIGSLKARLCALGNRSLYAWCEAHAVPFARLGKLIVSTAPDEDAQLDRIARLAAENGVTTLQELTSAQVRALEPHVRAIRGLWSPDTGIVDSHQLMASLLAETEARGGSVAWRHEITAAERQPEGYRLNVRSDSEVTTLDSRRVVNSAGLEALGVLLAAAMPMSPHQA
jgi:L-2-hydroxyglutarate oxidase LhgO